MSKRTIPFFSLEQQTAEIKPNIMEAISAVIDSQNFVGGTTVQNFETKLATYLKSPHAISCNSGTDALWLALKALDLQPDSIVLTTHFSFIASSSEIVAHGAHPVFIDIDEQSYNINPQRIQEWLELNTTKKKGILVHSITGLPVVGMVVVDLFGQCAEFKTIKTIAKKWGLWIVEDACQAIGAKEGKKMAGTLGDISTFSFYPTKNLGAFGEGGACITSDPHLAEKLLRLRNHGRKIHYEYEELGINSRMDSMQAAVLSVKLDSIDKLNDQRRSLAQRYHDNLKETSSIALPQELNGHHVYHQFCITTKTTEQRTALQKHLTDAGIGTNIFYPKPLFDISFLNTHKDLINPCPITKEKAATILALPIWPELKHEDIDYICDSIKAFELLQAPIPQENKKTAKQPIEKKRMKKEERSQQISLF